MAASPTENEILQMIELYSNGLKLAEISTIMHRKPGTISKYLKQRNIPIRNNTDYRTSEELATNKKYNFDTNYFEIIDSNEKAYWLGMIYADGNVFIRHGAKTSKGATFEIVLKEEDLYHLCNFKYCLNGDMPIREKNVKLNDKIFKSYRLIIGNIKFINDLIDKGCVPNKSLILEFPSENKLSPEFYASFIRGYFDGDGCVGFYKKEHRAQVYLSMAGTYKFLSKVKEILLNIGITHIGLNKDTRGNYWNLQTGSINNITKYFNYTYKENCYFLGRKYDKFITALEYFKKDYNISSTAKLSFLLDDDEI